jgi:hypothetical protein
MSKLDIFLSSGRYFAFSVDIIRIVPIRMDGQNRLLSGISSQRMKPAATMTRNGIIHDRPGRNLRS